MHTLPPHSMTAEQYKTVFRELIGMLDDPKLQKSVMALMHDLRMDVVAKDYFSLLA